jgi:hypothetical protein
MISASFALAGPRRRARAREEPPSATRPREEKGVRRKVCGTQ